MSRRLWFWIHKDFCHFVSSSRRGKSRRHDDTKICNVPCLRLGGANVADTTTRIFAMFRLGERRSPTRLFAMFRLVVSAGLKSPTRQHEYLLFFVSAKRNSPTRRHDYLQCFVSSCCRSERRQHDDTNICIFMSAPSGRHAQNDYTYADWNACLYYGCISIINGPEIF